MAKPVIHIRNVTAADIPSIVRIHYDAFASGPMDRLLHPLGVSADARLKFGNGIIPPIPTDPTKGDSITIVAELEPSTSKVEGPDGGAGQGQATDARVVAFAKWHLYSLERSETQWNVETYCKAEDLGAGADLEVFNAFIGELRRMRQRWMKVLDILACDPAHHRQGAGSGLLRWGMELADREQLTAWLEASPAGFPLYERFGFEAVEVQDLPISSRWKAVPREDEDWGITSASSSFGTVASGFFRTVMMRRLPRTVQP